MGMRNSTDFLTHDLTPGVQNLSSTKKKLDLIFYKESAMKAGRIAQFMRQIFFFSALFPHRFRLVHVHLQTLLNAFMLRS